MAASTNDNTNEDKSGFVAVRRGKDGLQSCIFLSWEHAAAYLQVEGQVEGQVEETKAEYALFATIQEALLYLNSQQPVQVQVQVQVPQQADVDAVAPKERNKRKRKEPPEAEEPEDKEEQKSTRTRLLSTSSRNKNQHQNQNQHQHQHQHQLPSTTTRRRRRRRNRSKLLCLCPKRQPNPPRRDRRPILLTMMTKATRQKAARVVTPNPMKNG
jgi:hypothetical protein